jgi:MFS transporter, SP family, arabinose:H+ symporter
MKITSHLLRSTAVGALGGLLFGFDTVVISGTTGQLTALFNLSPTALGQTVSIALWGTVVGCMIAGIWDSEWGAAMPSA